MNNKKKWASILTIAISLILCIVATFGVTLAFFGGNSTASLGTITLKTGVKVGASVTATDNTTKVVPGQQIEINATGTVEPYSSEGTVTSALLRVKFEVGGTMTVTPVFDTAQSITLKTADGDKTGYWVNGGDGYYYLCSTTANATVGNTTLLRFTPVNTTTDSAKTKAVLAGDFQVPTTLTNADSGKDLTVSATFEVIQGEIYVGTSSTPLTDAQLTIANTNVQSVFGEFLPERVLYENVNNTVNYANLWDASVMYPAKIIQNSTDGIIAYYQARCTDGDCGITYPYVSLEDTEIVLDSGKTTTEDFISETNAEWYCWSARIGTFANDYQYEYFEKLYTIEELEQICGEYDGRYDSSYDEDFVSGKDDVVFVTWWAPFASFPCFSSNYGFDYGYTFVIQWKEVPTNAEYLELITSGDLGIKLDWSEF